MRVFERWVFGCVCSFCVCLCNVRSLINLWNFCCFQPAKVRSFVRSVYVKSQCTRCTDILPIPTKNTRTHNYKPKNTNDGIHLACIIERQPTPQRSNSSSTVQMIVVDLLVYGMIANVDATNVYQCAQLCECLSGRTKKKIVEKESTVCVCVFCRQAIR